VGNGGWKRGSPIRPLRRAEWISRALFAGDEFGTLGNEPGLWLPTDELPGYEDFRLGQERSDVEVDAFANLALPTLWEVIAAAAGVEYSAEKVLRVSALIQAAVDEAGDAWAKENEGELVTLAQIWMAYAEFHGLLMWVRTLGERLDRRDAPAWVNGRSIRESGGLIPALRPGSLKKEVVRLHLELKRELIEETRPLANAVLHSAMIMSPMTSWAPMEAGRVLLAIPDRPARDTVRSSFDLTYDDHRSVEQFAIHSVEALDRFMDGVLEAFENRAAGGSERG
jgi:hypothetical protein